MKVLKNRIFKISAVLLMVTLLSVSLNLPEPCYNTDCYSYGVVYAAEDAEIPTIGASESADGDNTSADGSAQTAAEDDAQTKSSSKFFKIAIPVTCVLSLILAVILAVRGANKRYGKEWE